MPAEIDEEALLAEKFMKAQDKMPKKGSSTISSVSFNCIEVHDTIVSVSNFILCDRLRHQEAL